MSATVIVPTALGGPRLVRLLESLEVSEGIEVIVVANGTSDHEIDAASRLPGVRVIRLEHNVGYSRAVNLAARRASADTLVLLNDDCVCAPGYVEAIVAPLDAAAGVTMVSGVMVEARDPSRIDTAGMELDSTLLVWDYLNGEPVDVLDGSVPDPFGPSGAAAAIDREAFLVVGGFDENLFAYWEDVDLALRLRGAGGRCVLAPGARGTHEHSATLGSGSSRKNRLMGFGRGYVLRKWGVMTSPWRAVRVLATDGLICTGQAVSDGNLAGVAGRIQGYRVARRTEPYPRDALEAQATREGAIRTLRRRARRRARLRRAPAGMPRPAPHAIAVFHAAEITGPLRSLEGRLRWLAGAGSLDVVVPSPGPAAEMFEGVAAVTELGYQPLMLPRGPLGLPRAFVRLWREARAFDALLRRTRPDLLIVVSTLLPAALIAARRRRVPAIVHAAELHRAPEVDSPLRRVAGTGLIRLADRPGTEVIACSETVAAQFHGSQARERRATVTTIYPPIPDAYGGGDGAAFRDRHGIDPDARCIVAVGNITRGRGQDVLLEALPAIRLEVPDARCVIVGPTFQRPKDIAFERFLRELAAARGVADAVIFAGVETRIADAYAAADAVVNPARTPESFGRVTLEALAAGRPVVATRVGAVPEVAGEYDAVSLISPDDENALATAVIEVLRRGEGARQAARECGRHVLERFDPERGLEAFKRVVERTLPSSQS